VEANLRRDSAEALGDSTLSHDIISLAQSFARCKDRTDISPTAPQESELLSGVWWTLRCWLLKPAFSPSSYL
jgi:hypothetical protein